MEKTAVAPRTAIFTALGKVCAALWLLMPFASPVTANSEQSEQAQIRWGQKIEQFKGELRATSEFNPQWLEQTLSSATHNARVKRLMTPASGASSTVPDWQEYRSRLVSPPRIEAGVQFWRQNRQTLATVEERWGVPAHVIVGIIGIETFYGRNTGDIRALDALATLAFDYPAGHPRATERAAYFHRELEQFLRLSQQNGLDPLTVRGSFAGALGIAQFMPSSWMLYGEDYDRNGRADLIGSPQDAIASVANYLRAHGWKPGKPAWFEVQFDAAGADLATLLKPDILPTFDVASLESLGARIIPSEGKNYEGLLALVELRNGERPAQYIIGTENFYAITRYNQSSYYALAVLELGAEVARKLASPPPPGP